MRYIIVNNKYLKLSSWYENLFELWLELDNRGRVIKEIGFDMNKKIIHAYPSYKFEYGKYGIFDLNILDISVLTDDISVDKFYEVWYNIT